VFTCPLCHTPTARKWDQQRCPRCGSKHIKIKRTNLAYD
jgi:Zn finger protein HypA/HybF involved in hydrogenase expression